MLSPQSVALLSLSEPRVCLVKECPKRLVNLYLGIDGNALRLQVTQRGLRALGQEEESGTSHLILWVPEP